MSLVFSNYPNISCIDGKRKKKKGSSLKKRIKRLKKAIKHLQEQVDEGFTRKIDSEQKFTEEDAEKSKTSDTQDGRNKSEDNEKSRGGFWSRVADVVVKTLPSMLRTVVPMVITAIFGSVFKGSNRRSAMA